MKIRENSAISYIGADDLEIDLFENQFPLKEGMSYNSYVIEDEKIAVLDTIDRRQTGLWKEKLQAVLAGRMPDYLIVHHMEPDHSANIAWMMEQYPSCRCVCTTQAGKFIGQFFEGKHFADRLLVVKERDTLSLGKHHLQFFMAPMVHWPEVMVSYDETEKVLFSADAFGKFGALCNDTGDWTEEARRYYFNICGKFGVQVQALLQKLVALDVKTVCPLHGPVLKDHLEHYIKLYADWSAYRPETSGVFIAYCSLHGHTAEAALLLASQLEKKGIRAVAADLCRADLSACLADAFRYDRMVLAAPTYDGALMPVMQDFLNHLAAKVYQKRSVAIMENGTWAPQAAKHMRAHLEAMKEIRLLEPVVSIRSALNAESRTALEALGSLLATA